MEIGSCWAAIGFEDTRGVAALGTGADLRQARALSWTYDKRGVARVGIDRLMTMDD
ncbi:MAG: hypothetical protein ACI8TQ_002497 [Planctomycetota bacterium]|jgi:hypothetical protein